MNWLSKIWLLLPAFWAANVQAQSSLKKFVSENAVQINSIDPNDTSYTDLKYLDDAIGNSTIVMLGEQSHQDAPTFLAKTRIIKYLHEKKGFNVLAFESDFFALNHGWDNLAKEKSLTDDFLRNNIFSTWTYCKACENLFYEYIPGTFKTASPLIITGFDNQMMMKYSKEKLRNNLDSLFRQYNLSIISNTTFYSESLHLIDTLGYWLTEPADTILYQNITERLLKTRTEIVQYLGENNFWAMVLDNLISRSKSLESMAQGYVSNVSFKFRDEQMAKNLKWLKLQKFRDQKIIVWAHNMHISKYFEQVKIDPSKGIITMGGCLSQDSTISSQVYTIGFTSYSGTEATVKDKNHPFRKASSKSLEGAINKKWDFAFIDLRQYENPSERFLMNGFNHYDSEEQWARIYDGVFFIREMYPCEK